LSGELVDVGSPDIPLPRVMAPALVRIESVLPAR